MLLYLDQIRIFTNLGSNRDPYPHPDRKDVKLRPLVAQAPRAVRKSFYIIYDRAIDEEVLKRIKAQQEES